MKALLIDSILQTIVAIDVPKRNHLHEIYKALDCSTITAPVTFPNGDTLYCDDEYWLTQHDQLAGFMYPQWAYPICGKSLIIGCDEDGDDVDCKSTIEEITKDIIWMDHDQIKLLV
jgi:hypothetical protein